MHKVVTATLVGSSPYSQSKPIASVKPAGETAAAWEEKTWRERLHATDDGEVFVPGAAVKHMLADCAKFVSESVPGKGKATWTKHFEAGLMVFQNFPLGISVDDVKSERLFVPSDGKKGGGTRVWKVFPLIPEGWQIDVQMELFDPQLVANPDKVEEYLMFAGKFIGLGRWRPRRGGLYGRFNVKNFKVAA